MGDLGKIAREGGLSWNERVVAKRLLKGHEEKAAQIFAKSVTESEAQKTKKLQEYVAVEKRSEDEGGGYFLARIDELAKLGISPEEVQEIKDSFGSEDEQATEIEKLVLQKEIAVCVGDENSAKLQELLKEAKDNGFLINELVESIFSDWLNQQIANFNEVNEVLKPLIEIGNAEELQLVFADLVDRGENLYEFCRGDLEDSDFLVDQFQEFFRQKTEELLEEKNPEALFAFLLGGEPSSVEYLYEAFQELENKPNVLEFLEVKNVVEFALLLQNEKLKGLLQCISEIKATRAKGIDFDSVKEKALTLIANNKLPIDEKKQFLEKVELMHSLYAAIGDKEAFSVACEGCLQKSFDPKQLYGELLERIPRLKQPIDNN